MELWLPMTAMTGWAVVCTYRLNTAPSVIIPNSKYSSYNIFVKERFAEIKESSPDISKTEIFKIIGIEWKMKKNGF